MKKSITLFIPVISICLLTGCSQEKLKEEAPKKEKTVEKTEISSLINKYHNTEEDKTCKIVNIESSNVEDDNIVWGTVVCDGFSYKATTNLESKKQFEENYRDNYFTAKYNTEIKAMIDSVVNEFNATKGVNIKVDTIDSENYYYNIKYRISNKEELEKFLKDSNEKFDKLYLNMFISVSDEDKTKLGGETRTSEKLREFIDIHLKGVASMIMVE